MLDDLKLETLANGVLITTIITDSAGNLKPTGTVMEIISYNEKLGLWRYANQGSAKSSGHVPTSGGGRYFMSKNTVPDYWFSANQEHVKKALEIKELNRKAREKSDRIQAEDEARRMKKFLVEFALLREKYGAEISASQIGGDDQGVEIEMQILIGNTCKVFND